MSSIVLELQQEVLKPECDILSALRKAHVIASKLKLQEFDAWIMHELNGYPDGSKTDVPEYRKVYGSLMAMNPYRGWILVKIANPNIETQICEQFLWQSLSDIIELHKTSKSNFKIEFPGEFIAFLEKNSTVPFPTNYELHVGTHQLKTIVDKVANCLLEWTIKLESAGILGEDMRFSQEESAMAQKVPQTINYYYGTVINGGVKQSQVVSGNQNSISFNYGQANDLIKKVKDTIKDELPCGEDRDVADELIVEVESKLATQAKPRVIKAALIGLKEFLISSGANVTGGLIVEYLKQMLQ